MITMDNFYIKELLKNLCCSDCGADFDHFKVLRQEKNVLVLNLTCSKCGKDFGTCILSMCYSRNGEIIALNLQEGPDLITADEVIDANLLIRDLKSDWLNQIPKH